jgi:hypothetical protein
MARARDARRRWSGRDRGTRGRRRGRDRERELRDLGLTTESSKLGSQLEIRRDEPLILSGEELRDLAQGVDVAFVIQRHHAAAQ